jgi:hypothetical protein
MEQSRRHFRFGVSSASCLTWRIASGEGLPVSSLITSSFRDVLTRSSNCGLYFLDCGRQPRACDFRADRRLTVASLTAGFALDVASLHDRVIAPYYVRAESGDARIRCGARRGRQRPSWRSETTLSSSSLSACRTSPRILPCRGEADAELPRRASSADGRIMSRGRSWALAVWELPELSPAP